MHNRKPKANILSSVQSQIIMNTLKYGSRFSNFFETVTILMSCFKYVCVFIGNFSKMNVPREHAKAQHKIRKRR